MPYKILFFSNPLGLGHATRDVRMGRVLQTGFPEAEIVFSSSGPARHLIGERGGETIPSSFQETGYAQSLGRAAEVIRRVSPDLIISDEELQVLPLAKALLPVPPPCLFITDYLPGHIHPNALPLSQAEELAFFKMADSVAVVDFPEFYPVPKELEGRCSFLGPIVEGEGVDQAQRQAGREKFGLGAEACVVTLTAGGRVSHGNDIYPAVLDAFRRWTKPNKRLVVLAGERQSEIQKGILPDEPILVLGQIQNPEEVWALSDAAITRGGHTTLWELASMGVPSVSIPFPPHVNQLNHFFAHKMEKEGTTLVIKENELTTPYLLLQLERALSADGLGKGFQSFRKRRPVKAFSWRENLISLVQEKIPALQLCSNRRR